MPTRNATGSTAASLALTAEQESTITATAKASQGGANQNNKDANDADRGQGQSKGDGGGSIGIAGALGIAILDTDTKARVVGAKVHTTGSQNITAKAKNTLTASGDGSIAPDCAHPSTVRCCSVTAWSWTQESMAPLNSMELLRQELRTAADATDRVGEDSA